MSLPVVLPTHPAHDTFLLKYRKRLHDWLQDIIFEIVVTFCTHYLVLSGQNSRCLKPWITISSGRIDSGGYQRVWVVGDGRWRRYGRRLTSTWRKELRRDVKVEKEGVDDLTAIGRLIGATDGIGRGDGKGMVTDWRGDEDKNWGRDVKFAKEGLDDLVRWGEGLTRTLAMLRIQEIILLTWLEMNRDWSFSSS